MARGHIHAQANTQGSVALTLNGTGISHHNSRSFLRDSICIFFVCKHGFLYIHSLKTKLAKSFTETYLKIFFKNVFVSNHELGPSHFKTSSVLMT